MALKHKHLVLQQQKIDRAKRILRLGTEQETIEKALDRVIEEDAIVRAHRKLRGKGGMVDVFG